MSQEIEHRPVRRLDQILNIWEQTCFRLNAAAHLERGLGSHIELPLEEPLLSYVEFRRHLLRSSEQNHQFDWERFFGRDMRVKTKLGSLASVPYFLHQWTRDSRRVFRLSDDITEQLLNTDLDGVLWSDVRFPFESYGMELESPISIENVGSTDFILLNRVDTPAERGMVLSSLPTFLDDLPPLGQKDRQTITNLINRRRWLRLHSELTKLNERGMRVPYFPYYILQDDALNFPVTDIETMVGNEGLGATLAGQEMMRRVSRLVVGFCLYLRQLPVGSSHRSEWIKIPTSPDPTVITNETQVCYITSMVSHVTLYNY